LLSVFLTEAAGVANINNTAKSSRRPIIISAASTMRANRDSKTKKFELGPASPKAGPMFDIAEIDALIDSRNGAPVEATTIAPMSVMARNVVKKPMMRCTLSVGTGTLPSFTGTTLDGCDLDAKHLGTACGGTCAATNDHQHQQDDLSWRTPQHKVAQAVSAPGVAESAAGAQRHYVKDRVAKGRKKPALKQFTVGVPHVL